MPTVEENNSLKAQVAHLSKKLQEAKDDRAALAAERVNPIGEVGCLNREKQGMQCQTRLFRQVFY